MREIVFLCLFATALGIPARSQGQREDHVDIPVLRDEREGPVEADYRYALETGNGIRLEETGVAGSAGQSNKEGFFAFESPEGEIIEIRYTADENGFRPVGDHVPQPPAHVERLLAIAEKQRAEGIQFDERGFRIN